LVNMVVHSGAEMDMVVKWKENWLNTSVA
jgi:hypothetical protein